LDTGVAPEKDMAAAPSLTNWAAAPSSNHKKLESEAKNKSSEDSQNVNPV
jgi:hypothetical protein